VNTATASFNTTVRQMTEMIRWLKFLSKKWLKYLSEKNSLALACQLQDVRSRSWKTDLCSCNNRL